MAYSTTLAARVRDALLRTPHVQEKKMFGGVGFLLRGNILVGVWKTSLIVRVGPDAYEELLLDPNVGLFDITGKPMKGWIMVHADGLETDDQLKDWIERAFKFVRTLPPK